MNVTLPNGAIIQDVPDDITQSELARIAIINNLATEEDFVKRRRRKRRRKLSRGF